MAPPTIITKGLLTDTEVRKRLKHRVKDRGPGVECLRPIAQAPGSKAGRELSSNLETSRSRPLIKVLDSAHHRT